MKKRVTYRGRLRLPHGFHTGDGRRTGASDQPLFRQMDGSVLLAGSSLAGVLRADLALLVAACGGGPPLARHPEECSCLVCGLLGPEAAERRGEGPEDTGLCASRLYVNGAEVVSVAGPPEGSQQPAVRIRDHVGLDRRTRTAADKRKYDVEVLEGPLEVPFELRVADPREDEEQLLAATLRRLAGGWLTVGGKSGGGVGKAELVELSRQELAVDDREALVEHLLSDDPRTGCTSQILYNQDDRSWADRWDLAPAEGAVGGWAQIRLRLELEFPWGFLVNAPAEGLKEGFDHAFARRPNGEALLPGSSLRGALRSRGEQILRTISGDPAHAACDLNRSGSACHERIETENQARKERGDAPLSFDEEYARLCGACRVFGSGRYASPVKLTDFHPMPDRGGSCLDQDLVAIDRFTGGAASQQKFDARCRAGVTFGGELTLELGEDRLVAWSLGLLALVLRDLLLGDIPLGFGTARGFNEYRARVVGVDRFWLATPPVLEGLGLDGAGGTASWSPSEELDGPEAAARLAREPLSRRLGEWVAALHRQLATPGLQTDSEALQEDPQ